MHAARRRAAGGEPGRASQSRAAAARRSRRRCSGCWSRWPPCRPRATPTSSEASRDALIDRIDERQARGRLPARSGSASLREQNDELRADQRPGPGPARRGHGAAARPSQLSTGFVAVTGPGLRITVADNPDGSADGRVRATDLRLLVNGLWQAGAEAIAINGRRLSTLSAIVNSNIAIQVNRVAADPAVRRLGDRRRPDLAEPAAEPARRAPSSRRWPTSSASWSTGRMRPSSCSRRRPTSQLRLRYAEQGDAVAPDNQEDDAVIAVLGLRRGHRARAGAAPRRTPGARPLPADRRRRRARRRLRRAARLPRRHLRRQGVRDLVREQRGDRRRASSSSATSSASAASCRPA